MIVNSHFQRILLLVNGDVGEHTQTHIKTDTHTATRERTELPFHMKTPTTHTSYQKGDSTKTMATL